MVDEHRQFRENLGIMNGKEWQKLTNTRILLVGLGGLGGHIANSLARLGVKALTLVDFDHFEMSNLNRQLFSSLRVVGLSKVEVISEELKKINPNMQIGLYSSRVEDLEPSVFSKSDIIIDAVDVISTKLFLETMGTLHQKPLLHGAIGGWYGQIGFLMPDSGLLKEVYQNQLIGIEKEQKAPTFTPAIVANMMVSELVKYLIGSTTTLINKIMTIDLLTHDYRIVCQKKENTLSGGV